MKRNEILGELNSAKITAIKPGDSATVDTGQGITTTVDLKKNPTALMKDPESGKLKLTTNPTATNASPEQGGQEKSEIKPGDEIEIAAQEESGSKAASIEKAPDGTYTVKYLRAPLSASGTENDGKIPEPQTGIKDLASAQRIVASIEKEEEVANSMSSSIQVQDDTERLRALAGLPTNEQSPADQIAKYKQALGLGMKPQEFAPGEVKPSQIFGHPQWLSTVQAMHKKYPGNKDQAMQAAKDTITQLIKQGK
jgi:hypothetical protein